MTKMPPELAAAHDKVDRELTVLYAKWRDFRLLFFTDDKTVALFHRTAEFFFMVYAEVLRDNLILTVCRMTDPATDRGTKRSNLTLDYLVSLIPPTEGGLLAAVDPVLTRLKAKVAPFRHTRHRAIGHFDLLTAQKHPTSLMPNISFQNMVIVLGLMAKVLNQIERHFDGNVKNYREKLWASGDGAGLLQFIHEANAYQRYYDQKEYGQDPDEFGETG
jgi:hypothetical protein